MSTATAPSKAASAVVIPPNATRETVLAMIGSAPADKKQETLDAVSKWLDDNAPQPPAKPLYCKVSEKGGVSIYGLNAKWPVTLYAGQWERLIDFMPHIKSFIGAQNGKLSRK